jgi:hypothetical protein
MSLTGLRVGLFGLVASLACASGGGGAPRPTAARGALRSLAIVPASPSACPGEPIATRYVATASDGTRAPLSSGDLALLDRYGAGVSARADGSWQADVNPLVSAATGFRLHAVLKSDSSVRADTVLTPTYGCDKRTVDLRWSGAADANAFLRLGVLRSPFHDSIVVASLEVGSAVRQLFVLAPRDIRNGVIRLDASGRPGVAGKAGRAGTNGSACESGQPGENGDDGSAGGPGGRIDLIVQADAPWLANLVAISNQGGPGGAGGRGGAGGSAGRAGSGTGASCRSANGRNGNPGRQGPAGLSGPVPAVSTIPFPLLWTGSPNWKNEATRSALEQLIELTQR